MKSKFDYKGYFAEITYSDEDGIFVGKIKGINDLVLFSGESVEELKTAFIESVDEYLDICTRNGINPDKAYKGQFNIRINPDLHKKIAIEATMKSSSISKVIENALYEHFGKTEGECTQKCALKLYTEAWKNQRKQANVFKNYAPVRNLNESNVVNGRF